MKQETPLSLPNLMFVISYQLFPVTLALLGRPELKCSACEGHQRAVPSVSVTGGLAHATAVSSLTLVASTWDITQQIVTSSLGMTAKTEILLLDVLLLVLIFKAY